MIVNNFDLAALGFIGGARQFPDPGEQQAYQPAQGRPGGVRVGGAVPSATLSVEGVVLGASAAHAMERTTQVIAALRPRTPLRVRFPDRPGREWWCKLQTFKHREITGRYADKARSVSIVLALDPPFAVATAPTVLEATVDETGQVTIPLDLGDEISRPLIEVDAPLSSCSVFAAREVGGWGLLLPTAGLTWQGDAATPGTLVIDTETGRVTRGGANQLDKLTANSGLPVFDPAQGAEVLQVIGAAPGSMVRVRYHKSYWY